MRSNPPKSGREPESLETTADAPGSAAGRAELASTSLTPVALPVDEVTELRARVAHLEQTVQEMRLRHLTDLKALRQSQNLLNLILENTAALVFVKDIELRFILVNQRFEAFYGRPRTEILGRMAHEFLPGPVADRLEEEDRSILQRGERIEFEESVPSATGQVHTFLINKFPLTDATGATTGLCGIATDITDRKRAAEERALLQQQVIDSQRAALRELSTPLIPLSEGVLVVPLIGIIDRERGQMILEALLSGVTEQRAHTVIIDITGVRVVDSEIAQGLLRAARATRLLGAQTILTGLRAEVAKTLVQGGADFGGVVTLATLQAGIAYAMRIHPQ